MHSSREAQQLVLRDRSGGLAATLEEAVRGVPRAGPAGSGADSACGAVGASALIGDDHRLLRHPARPRAKFFIYPDYYLFHVGRPLGDHGRFDIWPRHKEVVVPGDADRLLEAVNDRGVTRLVVEDRAAGEPPSDPGALASARARVETCLAYSPSGRVEDADVRIAGNQVTEGYVEAILDPEARMARLRAEGEESAPMSIAVRPARWTAIRGSAFLPHGATWPRTGCRWRATGVSASTRRSSGWTAEPGN